MKKQTLLLMAGGILALASCNNEQAADAGMNQAQVDSAVNARVEEIRAELMAQNDSLINALAQWKADSIIAAMKGKPAPAASAKPKPTTTKTTEKPKSDGTKVTDRPGATNQSGTKVTDRPGATNQSGTKVTDRPGATNTNNK